MLNDFINSLDDTSDIKLPAMSRQIIISNNDIPSFKDYTSGLKEDRKFLDNRSYEKHQRGSEEINDNKNVRILVVKSKKITTIIRSIKLAFKKRLTMSIKVNLVENGQDVSIKKI